MEGFKLSKTVYLLNKEAYTVVKAYSADAFAICQNDDDTLGLQEAWEWYLNLCREEVALIKEFITDVYCGAKYFFPTWQMAMNYAQAFVQALDVTDAGRRAVWAEEDRQ